MPEALSDAALNHILSCLEDGRRLIAANKIRRWEAFKWAVTVNMALAGAAAAVREATAIFFFFALIAAGIAWLLMWHFSRLIGRSRDVVFDLGKHLAGPDRLKFQTETVPGRMRSPCPKDT